MEDVYRLFDRRCRTAKALAKLAALRARLRRFGRLREVLKKLRSPGLEKALVFLDERLMGATSNAVERGNRRYRKLQKTVYRVRTQRAIEGRLALDLQRERQGEGRAARCRGRRIGAMNSRHPLTADLLDRTRNQQRGCRPDAGGSDQRALAGILVGLVDRT